METGDLKSKIEQAVKQVSRQILPVLQIEALKSIRKNFEVGGRPKWTPRAKISRRQKGRKILVITGNLSNVGANIDYPQNIISITPNSLAQRYTRIHQEGGIINMPARKIKFRRKTGKSVFASSGHKRITKETLSKSYIIKIPARPYMVIPPEDFPRILNAVKIGVKI